MDEERITLAMGRLWDPSVVVRHGACDALRVTVVLKMIHCKYCGAEIDKVYCQKCGKLQIRTTPELEEEL